MSRGLHDPNVTTEHWAHIVDTERDHTPTRAECADVDEWPASKRAHEPCGSAGCLLCALQRRVTG